MDLRIIAGILLIGRLVALGFLIRTAMFQYRLFRSPTEVSTVRKIMFGLTCTLIFMQFVPITIDVFALFTERAGSGRIPLTLGIAYAFSNMTFSIIASILLWQIYEVIGRETEEVAKENDELKHDNKELQIELSKEKSKH